MKTNQEIRKEFEVFIDQLPQRVNETPKEVLIDRFLTQRSQDIEEIKSWAEENKETYNGGLEGFEKRAGADLRALVFAYNQALSDLLSFLNSLK